MTGNISTNLGMGDMLCALFSLGSLSIVYVASAESDISLFIPGQTKFSSASPYVCVCVCVCLSIATPSCDKWS